MAHLVPHVCFFETFVSSKLPQALGGDIQTIVHAAILMAEQHGGSSNPAEGKDSSTTDRLDMVRAAWAAVTPKRSDYASVVAEIQAAKALGDSGCFERGPHVPITHMGYFRPPNDAFLIELRSKDQRSAKEWEYINAAGVWLEVAMFSMEMVRTGNDDTQSFATKLRMAEAGMAAAMEVLSMRAQYFRDIVTFGIEQARQMANLVEGNQDTTFSSSYRTARDALATRIELEAAKELARARLGKKPGVDGKAAGSE